MHHLPCLHQCLIPLMRDGAGEMAEGVGAMVGVMAGVMVGAGRLAGVARAATAWGSCTTGLDRMLAMLGQNQQVPGRFLYWQQLNLRL